MSIVDCTVIDFESVLGGRALPSERHNSRRFQYLKARKRNNHCYRINLASDFTQLPVINNISNPCICRLRPIQSILMQGVPAFRYAQGGSIHCLRNEVARSFYVGIQVFVELIWLTPYHRMPLKLHSVENMNTSNRIFCLLLSTKCRFEKIAQHSIAPARIHSSQ